MLTDFRNNITTPDLFVAKMVYVDFIEFSGSKSHEFVGQIHLHDLLNCEDPFLRD